jgi:hypothetical protein
MNQSPFLKAVTTAARTVARIEVQLREARKRLAAMEERCAVARRELRMLASTIEPYEPSGTNPAVEINDRADGLV